MDGKIGLECRQKVGLNGKVGLECRQKVDLDGKVGLEGNVGLGRKSAKLQERSESSQASNGNLIAAQIRSESGPWTERSACKVARRVSWTERSACKVAGRVSWTESSTCKVVLDGEVGLIDR